MVQPSRWYGDASLPYGTFPYAQDKQISESGRHLLVQMPWSRVVVASIASV